MDEVLEARPSGTLYILNGIYAFLTKTCQYFTDFRIKLFNKLCPQNCGYTIVYSVLGARPPCSLYSPDEIHVF